jgi:hypothetical protein
VADRPIVVTVGGVGRVGDLTQRSAPEMQEIALADEREADRSEAARTRSD